MCKHVRICNSKMEYCTKTLRCLSFGQLPRHKKYKLWSTEGKPPVRTILRSSVAAIMFFLSPTGSEGEREYQSLKAIFRR
jgi:hypothetical protein